MIFYKALSTLLLDKGKCTDILTLKKKKKSNVMLFYTKSPLLFNFDMSKYRMFYFCSIKFAIINITLVIYFYNDKKIEATKKEIIN